MESIMAFFVVGQILVCLGLIVYILTLAARFVRAHERVADSLDKIARKQTDGPKP